MVLWFYTNLHPAVSHKSRTPVINMTVFSSSVCLQMAPEILLDCLQRYCQAASEKLPDCSYRFCKTTPQRHCQTAPRDTVSLPPDILSNCPHRYYQTAPEILPDSAPKYCQALPKDAARWPSNISCLTCVC